MGVYSSKCVQASLNKLDYIQTFSQFKHINILNKKKYVAQNSNDSFPLKARTNIHAKIPKCHERREQFLYDYGRN